MPMSNVDNPHHDKAVQHVADKAAAEVTKIADAEGVAETVEVRIDELPPEGALVATRTRRVQYGERTHDLVEGEPVDVDPSEVEDWIARGWIHHV